MNILVERRWGNKAGGKEEKLRGDSWMGGGDLQIVGVREDLERMI